MLRAALSHLRAGAVMPRALAARLSGSASAPAPPAAPLTAPALEARLRAAPALAPLAHARVVDTSGGCGAFFSVVVVSPAFESLAPLRAHRAVTAALGPGVAQMHGMTIRALTPADWGRELAAAGAARSTPSA